MCCWCCLCSGWLWFCICWILLLVVWCCLIWVICGFVGIGLCWDWWGGLDCWLLCWCLWLCGCWVVVIVLLWCWSGGMIDWCVCGFFGLVWKGVGLVECLVKYFVVEFCYDVVDWEWCVFFCFENDCDVVGYELCCDCFDECVVE